MTRRPPTPRNTELSRKRTAALLSTLRKLKQEAKSLKTRIEAAEEADRFYLPARAPART